MVPCCEIEKGEEQKIMFNGRIRLFNEEGVLK